MRIDIIKSLRTLRKRVVKMLNANFASSFGMTDTGLKRTNNEDGFWISPSDDLFVVVDGMGGQNAGAVASKMAIELLQEALTTASLQGADSKPEKIEDLFRQALSNASSRILMSGKENPEYSGMGCTAAVAWRSGNMLHSSHVGDARVYVCNEENITQLGYDHSYVAESVKLGKMTREEARQSELKNQVTQALGMPNPVDPEYQKVELHSGDRVLLCSDGLWDMLSDSEIHQILMHSRKTRTICNELIRKAKEAGGNDNITVVVSL